MLTLAAVINTAKGIARGYGPDASMHYRMAVSLDAYATLVIASWEAEKFGVFCGGAEDDTLPTLNTIMLQGFEVRLDENMDDIVPVVEPVCRIKGPGGAE